MAVGGRSGLQGLIRKIQRSYKEMVPWMNGVAKKINGAKK